MKFSDKFIRGQLELARPLTDASSLETVRAVQDKLGRLLRFTNRHKVAVHGYDFGSVKGAVVVPRDELRSGMILYLHGGGYVSGTLDYALGFASVLAAECGMRVGCIEYSLAPQSPFPTAINECVLAYRFLIENGYPSESIVLAGESAGGGLCYALSLKIKELSLPRPAGIIAVSPWCDLTQSGESYEENKKKDPSLTKARLDFFASSYIGSPTDRKNKRKLRLDSLKNAHLLKNPLVSPIFADLSDIAPSVIFAGGDEILLSDSVAMSKRLDFYGVKNRLYVKEGMWHAYQLYSLKSCEDDFKEINKFLKEVLPPGSQRKLRWMQLDNSAKIYPAVATADWTNVFRLSVIFVGINDNINRYAILYGIVF